MRCVRVDVKGMGKLYIGLGVSSVGGVGMVGLKCPRCGHEWNYKGELLLATCPSCGKKVQVKESDLTHAKQACDAGRR